MNGQPKTAGDELRFALAGPAVTAVVAAIFGALASSCRHRRRPHCELWLATRSRSTC